MSWELFWISCSCNAAGDFDRADNPVHFPKLATWHCTVTACDVAVLNFYQAEPCGLLQCKIVKLVIRSA